MKSITPHWLPILAVCIFQIQAHADSNLPPQLLPSLSQERIPASGAGESSAPWVSSDGRFVVFTSLAPNLTGNDTNGSLDVFGYDLTTKELELVSINRAGGGTGNGRSVCFGVSTNGSRVLFQSEASDLVANDTNGIPDLFVRDSSDSETVLVSVNNDGLPAGAFLNPGLSADGRWLHFEEFPKSLVTNTTWNSDVYIRDLALGANRLVSVAKDGTTGGSGHSENAVMSSNGRWIVFQSRAANLLSNDLNSDSDIYLADLESGTLILASQNAWGTNAAAGASMNPDISADGRFVAFESTSLDLGTNAPPAGATSVIYLRDLVLNQTVCVSVLEENLKCYRPVLSPEGRYVAYENGTNLFFWDSTTHTATMMTTNALGQAGNDVSHSPQFTPDARFCLFVSSATNLSSLATNSFQSQIYRRDMVTGEIEVVSGNCAFDRSNPGATAADMSDDGNIIAFQSGEPQLAAGDFNESDDVFVFDTSAGTTELISRRMMALPPAGAMERSFSWPNSVSADGRYVVFYSSSRSLVTNATGGAQNLFVRDLWTGQTRLVTATPQGTECGNGAHYAPAISGDGRWVAFGSSATNLVAGDANNYSDIFARDLWNGTNYVVSAPWSQSGAANNYSLNPSISYDGRFIAFQSLANNLVPLDAGAVDAFVRDLAAPTNVPLSVLATAASCAGGQVNPGNGVFNPFAPVIQPAGDWVLLWSQVKLTTNLNLSGTPYCIARNFKTRQMISLGILTNGLIQSANRSATMSVDGRFAAFCTSNNLVGVYDFAARSNAFAVAAARNPTISADGRWLAFEGRASDHGTNSGNTISDVFLLDRQSGSVRLVSFSQSGLGGNGASSMPLITRDGRYVVFKSKATDLVEGDTNGLTDVFVRDVETGTVIALSGRAEGSTGNSLSGNPVLGPDGRTVLFESYASDLAPGDFNGAKDLFVLRLPGDVASELRILTLTSLGTGTTILYWNAIPGWTYRVEYKGALTEDAWHELPGDVVATGYTGSKADNTASQAARFYRVKLL